MKSNDIKLRVKFLIILKGNPDIKKGQPFYIADNHLIYRPLELKVIIDPDEKKEVMKEVFNDDRTGVGSGIVQFYHNICRKYLNIQRKNVADFLMRQKNYQLSRNTRHHINKPILADAPNMRWAIDLVDMNRYIDQNRGYRYISVSYTHLTLPTILRV